MKGDKFWFSPDIGYLVERGDFYYTEHGHIMPTTSVIRCMPVDGCENYADWTNEHRTEVRLAFDVQCKKYDAKRKREEKKRAALVEQARKKLTEAEFDAVALLGRD